MDIISMQIANKVLKRMNKEFNGLYDVFTATEGQTEFITSKPHDIQNKGLHVYVNGYHATETLDYTHTNETTIVFTNPLQKDDIVVLATQVAGVPKLVMPPYDDVAIKGEIESLKTRVNTIVSALDDDIDGDILDTIANLKAQWDAADEDLKQLVSQKASAEELTAASLKLTQAELAISTAQAELEGAKTELAAAKLDLSSAKGELEITKGDLDSTKEGLNQTILELSNTNKQLALASQTLTTVNNELVLTKDSLTRTDGELTTTKEELTTTKESLATTALEVTSLRELASSQAELIVALADKVTLLDKIINPVAEDYIKFNDPVTTTIAKSANAENDPPYQLIQVNYSRLQEVDATTLTITGVGNDEVELNKQYHTTPGATSVNASAMFQWSYRDLSTLDEEGSNLDVLERTNDTLLKEGTKLEFKIQAVKGGKTFTIVSPYTITSDDVLNATCAEVE